MSTRNSSAGNVLLVSRSAARTAFAQALNLYVGRGRRYSVKQLSNATGVPDRVIECAREDCEGTEHRNTPLEAVLSISAFLGSEFTSEWLAAARQAAFDLPDGPELPPGDLAADNAEDNAAITSAARDGVFNREERQRLRPVGLRMVQRGHELAALSVA